MQAESEADVPGMRPFWHALTNSSGNFTIGMGGVPANFNPWKVRLESSTLGRLVPSRIDTILSVSTGSAVVNFDLVLGTILTGRVTDPVGAPIFDSYPHVHAATNPPGEGNIGANTGPDGYYQFAVPPGSWYLHFTKYGCRDKWWDNKTSSMTANVIVTTTQDTIKNLNAVLFTSAVIRGTVRNYDMLGVDGRWVRVVPAVRYPESLADTLGRPAGRRGMGIMADDLLAGLYAAALLHAAAWWLGA